MKVRVTGAMLRWSVSSLALITASLGASHSFAQAKPSTAGSSAGTVEEITVTARKREETLKDVPLAISVVTETALKQANVISMEDLAKVTPGLAVATTGGTYQTPVIRGLAQVDQSSATGNVGVFIDGILLNNRSGQEFGFLDVSRIEVVKGPQSASYGQNTFSGAINYVTKAPILGKYDAFFAGDVGTYGYYSTQGSVNIPISDKFALRVAGGKSQFNGTIPNIRDGQDLGGWKNHSTYSGSLLFTPTDDVRVRAYYERTDTYENQVPYAWLGGGAVLGSAQANNCGSTWLVGAVKGTNPPTAAGGVTATNGGTVYNSLYCGQLPVPKSVNLLSTSPASGLVGYANLGYVSADWDLKFATLTGTYGYGAARFAQFNDTGANPAAITQVNAASCTAQFVNQYNPNGALAGCQYSNQTYLTSVGTGSYEHSYEVKLASPSGQRFTWIAGLYDYDSFVQDATVGFISLLNQPSSIVQSPSTPSAGLKKYGGRAIYGVIAYDVTPNLNLRAEGRAATDTYNITSPYNATTRGQATWNSTTPRFTATYKVNSDVNIYASAAEGFKIGGFNAAALSTNPALNLPALFVYKPETNWTYEFGVKGSLFNHKLQFDTDIYYIDWSNIQVQQYNSIIGTSLVTNNIGAISDGWEASVTYNFTRNLWLRAAGTILDPHYKSGTIDGEVAPYCVAQGANFYPVSVGCSPAVGGKQLARTSNRQADFAGQWTIPDAFPGYDAYAHGDFSYQSARSYLSTGANSEGDIELLNLRFGVKHNNYELAFWMKNAMDYAYLARSTQSPSGFGAGVIGTRLYPGAHRTLGAEISARW